MSLNAEGYNLFIESLVGIRDALEKQNKLLNDIIHYPQDITQPPRIMTEVTGVIVTTDDEEP
jgi:hypothetical protein